MATLKLDAKLARALGVLGGRSLFKTAEALAAGICVPLGTTMSSDGTTIRMVVDNKQVEATVSAESPLVKEGSYIMQGGTVIFSGGKEQLERVKAALLHLAQRRSGYLLDMYTPAHCSRYQMEKKYLEKLWDHVVEIKVSGP